MDSHLGIDAVTESSRLEFRPEILDLIIAAAIGGLALAFWHGAAAFDEGDASGVGPATFPRGLALLLGVVALILALRAAVGLARFQPQATASIERPWKRVTTSPLLMPA